MVNTHMGQAPSLHIPLESTIVANPDDIPRDFNFRRINPDGTVVEGPPQFSVSEDQVLVVTDVDWEYRVSFVNFKSI